MNTGVQLVIENDGTPIEDDEVLVAVQSETLLLLACGEIWQPASTFIDLVVEDESNSMETDPIHDDDISIPIPQSDGKSYH